MTIKKKNEDKYKRYLKKNGMERPRKKKDEEDDSISEEEFSDILSALKEEDSAGEIGRAVTPYLGGDDDEEALAQGEEFQSRRENLEKSLSLANNPWGLSPRALEAKKAAMSLVSIKNGMHSRVPIVCLGESCPYSRNCQLLPFGLAPRGEYCPTELAQIELRTAGYSQDIDFEEASFTDMNLMSELVALDIMLERCKGLMAAEGVPVVEIAMGVDSEGNEIRQPNVSKAWEAYEKISKKRDATYQLLMMTRKDKKNKNNEDQAAQDVSSVLKDVIENVEL